MPETEPDTESKPCRHCGAEFTGDTPTAYCSPRCWMDAKAARSRAYYERRNGLREVSR